MDLNVMMREQAINGLQATLDKAVMDGDTVAARKTADDLAKLAVSTAPRAPVFSGADVYAELEKTDWYGVDPKKSAKAEEFGKTMNTKKFATAAAFAAALIKAVEEEFKPAATEPVEEEGEEEEGEEKPPVEKRARKTDGPGEGDNNQRGSARRASGPWAKVSDAPADIQKEIKRQADKFVSSSASKEQRETFINKALESHYATHVRNKGKK